jgi:hypothetical protein
MMDVIGEMVEEAKAMRRSDDSMVLNYHCGGKLRTVVLGDLKNRLHYSASWEDGVVQREVGLYVTCPCGQEHLVMFNAWEAPEKREEQ